MLCLDLPPNFGLEKLCISRSLPFAKKEKRIPPQQRPERTNRPGHATHLLGAGSKVHNRRIERELSRWAGLVSLADNLRTVRMAQAQNGEGFAVLTSNPRFPTPVKLDLCLVETDQVSRSDLNALGGKQSLGSSSTTAAIRYSRRCWGASGRCSAGCPTVQPHADRGGNSLVPAGPPCAGPRHY